MEKQTNKSQTTRASLNSSLFHKEWSGKGLHFSKKNIFLMGCKNNKFWQICKYNLFWSFSLCFCLLENTSHILQKKKTSISTVQHFTHRFGICWTGIMYCKFWKSSPSLHFASLRAKSKVTEDLKFLYQGEAKWSREIKTNLMLHTLNLFFYLM